MLSFIKSCASVLSQDIIFASFPSLLSPQRNNVREFSYQKAGLKNEKRKEKSVLSPRREDPSESSLLVVGPALSQTQKDGHQGWSSSS